MNHYCHSCGTKNNYVNGVKPKFCTNCGTGLEVVKAKREEPRGRPTGEESRSSWRDEWKGGSSIRLEDEDGDLDDIMRNLKSSSGFNVEKGKFLTVADLKEMPAESTGRDAAPQGNKEMVGTRAEIMKNLGVSNQNNAN
jgi:hypothetical protein